MNDEKRPEPRGLSEGLYSHVSRRLYSDARFRALSAPKPNAQSLWLYLLVGDHNTVIPGLFSIGELGLAERLRWPVGATKKALAEIEAAEMLVVDRAAPLIWLPHAVRHNPPISPAVIAGWGRAWRALPESPLRETAAAWLRDELSTLGGSFAMAFETVLMGAVPEPEEASRAMSHLSAIRSEAGKKGARRRWQKDCLPSRLPSVLPSADDGKLPDAKMANLARSDQDQDPEQDPERARAGAMAKPMANGMANPIANGEDPIPGLLFQAMREGSRSLAKLHDNREVMLDKTANGIYGRHMARHPNPDVWQASLVPLIHETATEIQREIDAAEQTHDPLSAIEIMRKLNIFVDRAIKNPMAKVSQPRSARLPQGPAVQPEREGPPAWMVGG